MPNLSADLAAKAASENRSADEPVPSEPAVNAVERPTGPEIPSLPDEVLDAFFEVFDIDQDDNPKDFDKALFRLGQVTRDHDEKENGGGDLYLDEVSVRLAKKFVDTYEFDKGYKDYDHLVASKKRDARAAEQARTEVASERAADQISAFEIVAMDNRVSREKPKWRIEHLMPAGGYTLFVAYKKTGKTTTLLNLIKSLTTGEPFLGRLATRKVEGRVTFINFEMTEDMIEEWVEDLGIPEDKLNVVHLRGRAAAFNVLDDRIRAQLAQRLRAHNTEVLIVDPFGPLFRAFCDNGNNNTRIGSIVDGINALVTEAGISEWVASYHTGHDDKGRARDASVIEETPDVIAVLEGAGVRYFSTRGRDTNYKTALDFDRATRTLLATEGGPESSPPKSSGASPEKTLIMVLDEGEAPNDLSRRATKEWLKANDHSHLSGATNDNVLSKVINVRQNRTERNAA
ncbi:AAA family ATPase [Actinomadura sediminis]|uniref:AAA family ATPase n=1 Tax=Actinomadura sediminis TaxID=1038904 RepID=A0ABW3EQF7_9ACTN